MKYRRLQFLILVLALTTLAVAQDLDSFEKRVTVKKLANGMTVIICSRPEAPVFSFYTHVDAGSVQDPQGKTGLAHMFEHMAFKGTDKIGTKDYAAEKVALAKVETIYAAYIRERDKPVGRDDKKVEALKKDWQDAVKDAQQYVVEGAFDDVLERNGAQGVNASTNDDETNYFYSLPANRLELWAYLESERFLHPVMREFYKERDVVIEERRLRTDSNPVGRAGRAVFNCGLSGASLSPANYWLDVRLEYILRDRRTTFLRSVLYPVEHGSDCGRGREPSLSRTDD